MIVKGCGLEPEGVRTKAFEKLLGQKFGIEICNEVPNGHKGQVKAVLMPMEKPTKRFWYAAPWFMNWYCASSLIDPEIREVVRRLCDVWFKGWGRIIYRGESAEFPSVRSTLSRKWHTTSVEAIRSIKEKNRIDAAQRRQMNAAESADPDAAMQHLGGASNLIDFSLNIWTAAYFACRGGTAGNGRVWAFDAQTVRKETRIVQRSSTGDDTADRRTERQQSIFVEPDSGVIHANDLEMVCRFEPALKTKMLDFLKSIGIEEAVLFPDMLGLVQNEDDAIPMKALAHMIMGWIKSGDLERAYSSTTGLLCGHSSESDLNKRTFLYLRGITTALLMHPKESHRDLVESAALFGRKVPKALRRNLNYVGAAAKSGDCSRLRTRLDLEVPDGLWSETLEGYQFVEDI